MRTKECNTTQSVSEGQDEVLESEAQLISDGRKCNKKALAAAGSRHHLLDFSLTFCQETQVL